MIRVSCWVIVEDGQRHEEVKEMEDAAVARDFAARWTRRCYEGGFEGATAIWFR